MSKARATAERVEARPAEVRLRARRSPRLVLLGVLAIAIGGLGGAALYANSNSNSFVVSMAHDVVRGQEITDADLKVVALPAGLAAESINGTELDQLIGQTALRDLPAGSFPAQRHLGSEPLPKGHSLVGIKLVSGRLPTSPLPTGSLIQLISLAAENSEPIDAVVATAPALLDDRSGYVLDVILPDTDAPQVAKLAANEQLVLIAVGDE